MSGGPSRPQATYRDEGPEIKIDIGDKRSERILTTDVEAPEDANRRVQEWAEQAAQEHASGTGEEALHKELEAQQDYPAPPADDLTPAQEGSAVLPGPKSESRVEDQKSGDEREVASSGDEGGAAGVAKSKKKQIIAASLRKWLRIDSNGETQTIGSSKYKMAQKLGVQPRDLRFLELQTQGFSPPALLARENAIVVSFESIRCIITLDYVLVINPEDERVAGLLQEFKSQLRKPAAQVNKKGYPGVSKLSDVANKLRYGRAIIELPFELKVLEICFDKMVSELSSAASELEREALPALEVLTRRIRQADLEAVRRVKSKLVRLKTRIESIHEVLERYLDHDEDMHRLNLTAEDLSRQASEQEHQMRTKAAEEAAARAALRRAMGGVQVTPRGSRDAAGAGAVQQQRRSTLTAGNVMDAEKRLHRDAASSHSSFDSQDEAEVAEVEMLLEAYDMHLEHALSRLQTLDEYIQDTEDLINTGLDQKRNELITCDILLSSNIVALGLMTTISSIMAMNIVPEPLQDAPNVFNFVAIGSTAGVYCVYGFFLLWAMKQNLLAF